MVAVLEFMIGLMVMISFVSIGIYYAVHETSIHKKVLSIIKRHKNRRRIKKAKKFIRKTMKQFTKKMR